MSVKVTAARIASDDEVKQYQFEPKAGYRMVLVFLTYKNAARYPSCSYPDEWLRVREGYEYPRVRPKYSTSEFNPPRSNNLPPTEESTGGIAFEIKDGMHPSALKIVRNWMGESLCATMQHRSISATHDTVILSLAGLPSK